MHDGAPAVALKVPAGQSVQLAAPEVEVRPTGQLAQVLEPEVLAKVPAAQLRHAGEPDVGA